MTKAYKELPALVKRAKQRGFQVRGGTNGGGWFRLATACGYEGEMPINKTTARAFLRKVLDYTPPSCRGGRQALQRRLQNERSEWNQ